MRSMPICSKISSRSPPALVPLRKRDALPPGGIFEAAQLDDAARCGVARRVEVGQADMMSAPIHPSITA